MCKITCRCNKTRRRSRRNKLYSMMWNTAMRTQTNLTHYDLNWINVQTLNHAPSHCCFNPSPLTSMMGLDAITFSSTLVSLLEPPTVAKYRMAYFAETVFPAPDSPLTMMDWFLSSLQNDQRRSVYHLAQKQPDDLPPEDDAVIAAEKTCITLNCTDILHCSYICDKLRSVWQSIV